MAKEDRTERKRLSLYLTDIDTFIRATAVTDDVFSAYSLSEAVLERKDIIGKLEDAESLFSDESNASIQFNPRTGRMTLQAELLKLEQEGLWAIKRALELEEEMKKATPSEIESNEGSDDPEEIPAEDALDLNDE